MGMTGLGGTGTDSSDDDGGAPIVAEINITPLTDIFLVLLIIFMVTSSVLTQMGVDVNLPQSQGAAAARGEREGVLVTLLPGGEMRVNQKAVKNVGELESAVKAAFASMKSREIILEGDRQAFLGRAIEVMDAARRAGATKFGIATSESGGASPGEARGR